MTGDAPSHWHGLTLNQASMENKAQGRAGGQVDQGIVFVVA